MIPIVFLHVPKTAGQTVHSELVRAVGGATHVSPVRVTAQAVDGRQMPEGYRLYSGHIDWVELAQLPKTRFAFTILRNPKERIASFYLYMCKEARAATPEALSLPENIGKRRALELSADDYFFGGDEAWHRFVRAMYDNFYCSYFATRRMNGWASLREISGQERIDRALHGLRSLSGVYSIEDLARLERDFAARFDLTLNLTQTFANTGGHNLGEARWPKLCAQFEKDRSIERLRSFFELDDILYQKALTQVALPVMDQVAVVTP